MDVIKMTMKRLHKFDNTLVGQTIWGAIQMIGENISLGKDPIDWVLFFAEIAEMYGEI